MKTKNAVRDIFILSGIGACVIVGLNHSAPLGIIAGLVIAVLCFKTRW